MKRLFRFLVPHKEWFVVWGFGFAACKPRKCLKWVWLDVPLNLMFEGWRCDTEQEADEILSEVIELEAKP